MRKWDLVQAFGELAFFGGCDKDYLKSEMEDYAFYTQKFTWNDIGCELDFEEDEYPNLTVDQVKEECADYILKRIGKHIECMLVH